jgi:hypothetical protein
MVSDDRMINDCGTVNGIRNDRGNQSGQIKPASLLLFPPQSPT